MGRASNWNLVQLRAARGEHNVHGPTASEINARVAPEEGPAKVVARDLRRYYTLVELSLAELGLDGPDGQQLIETAARAALSRETRPGLPLHGVVWEFLPSAVHDLCERAGAVDAEWGQALQRLDGVLQEATAAQVLAVSDAVERAAVELVGGSDRRLLDVSPG